MEPIRCMIIDDEPLAVELIKRFVERTPYLQLDKCFTDSVEALAELKTHPVDLLFLDIHMRDLDGMSLAAMVPEETRIIFTTAFGEYAIDSYGVNALDFLLKPINYARFLVAAEKAKQWFEIIRQNKSDNKPDANAPHDTIFLRVDGELKRINLSSILYVASLDNYIKFYLEGEKRPLITHLSMKAVEDVLPAKDFMRVHRSYMVALQKIQSVDRNNTIHIGGSFIHISDSYLDAFNAYIKDILPK